MKRFGQAGPAESYAYMHPVVTQLDGRSSNSTLSHMVVNREPPSPGPAIDFFA